MHHEHLNQYSRIQPGVDLRCGVLEPCYEPVAAIDCGASRWPGDADGGYQHVIPVDDGRAGPTQEFLLLDGATTPARGSQAFQSQDTQVEGVKAAS